MPIGRICAVLNGQQSRPVIGAEIVLSVGTLQKLSGRVHRNMVFTGGDSFRKAGQQIVSAAFARGSGPDNGSVRRRFIIRILEKAGVTGVHKEGNDGSRDGQGQEVFFHRSEGV